MNGQDAMNPRHVEAAHDAEWPTARAEIVVTPAPVTPITVNFTTTKGSERP